jgi:hypothetical protein
MAPVSICVASGCHYTWDGMEEVEIQLSRPPVLLRCPQCHSSMVYCCPRCKASVQRVPTGSVPNCEWCGYDLYGFIFRKGDSRYLAAHKRATA